MRAAEVCWPVPSTCRQGCSDSHPAATPQKVWRDHKSQVDDDHTSFAPNCPDATCSSNMQQSTCCPIAQTTWSSCCHDTMHANATTFTNGSAVPPCSAPAKVHLHPTCQTLLLPLFSSCCQITSIHLVRLWAPPLDDCPKPHCRTTAMNPPVAVLRQLVELLLP